MEDNFSKILRLFGTLFLTFLSCIAALVIIMLGIRFFFGLLSYIPWMNYVYMILILTIPAALFITAYIIYFKRTRYHRSAVVKWISLLLFSAALVTWVIFYIWDIITFSMYGYTDIGIYKSYNMLYLFINVACIFFVGVLQALSSEKEKDWMERSRH